MLTGAALLVADRRKAGAARPGAPSRRAVRALAGVAAALALASCRPSHRAAPAADGAAPPKAGVVQVAPAPEPQPPRGKQIVIGYSSNLFGEYEHCGCPAHPVGGLARRATKLDQARAEADGVVVLDAGDLLMPSALELPGKTAPKANAAGLLPPDPGEVTRRAHLLLAAMARSGLAAFAPGERDLSIGPPLLRRLLAEHKIPVVAANLFDDQGRRFFDADRMLEVAGLKIGVFGLIDAAPEEAALWKSWRLEARDPIATARAEVAALRARGASMVIALVHIPAYDVTKKLLRAAPGIDWAVLGHTSFNLETPDDIGGARVLEAMSMGKDFGRLDLHLVTAQAAQAGDGPFVDRGQHAQLQGILDDHQRQIAELRARAGEQPPIMQAHFAERVRKLDKAIANDRELLRAHPAEIHGNWFENRILPLDAAIPDHPAVAMLVTAYNRENQRRATAGLPVGIMMRNPLAPRPVASVTAAGAEGAASDETLRYAGAVACGSCHAAALAFWQTTAHARALATLKKVKRDRDPTCVGCHVTGYLRPGGTGDLRLASARLRDVGCEACHGPGLDHVTAESGIKKAAAGMHRPVAPSVCLGCHTPDQTNGDFDHPHYLNAILGPGHGGV